MALPHTVQPHSSPGFPPAIGRHTALFTAFINQEQGRDAALYHVKLTEIESQLKIALDEAEYLRMKNSQMGLSLKQLQQRLEAVKQESIASGDDLVRRTRSVARILISLFRKRVAKLEAIQEESKKQLVEALSDRQAAQRELNASRAQVQTFEWDMQEARTAESVAKNETLTLKMTTIAQLEKSLTEANNSEVSLKRYVYLFRDQNAALERELSSVKESSRAEHQRLSQEKANLQQDLTTRLETVMQNASSHETNAKEATERGDLLLEQLERERRESDSTFAALQRQATDATLAGHREAVQSQAQLTSLAAQLSKMETALAEATGKVKQSDQEISGLRRALSEAESTHRATKTEDDMTMEKFLVTLAFLRKNLNDVQTNAGKQIQQLRRQLSALHDQGCSERNDLETRLSSFVATLHQHQIASFDSDSDVLKPSPKLVCMWETIRELIPVSQREFISSFVCFPEHLTADTTPVIPAISTLVDHLRHYIYSVRHLRQVQMAERDQEINSSQGEMKQISLPDVVVALPVPPSTPGKPKEVDRPPQSQSQVLSINLPQSITVDAGQEPNIALPTSPSSAFVSKNTDVTKTLHPKAGTDDSTTPAVPPVSTTFHLGQEPNVTLPYPEMISSKADDMLGKFNSNAVGDDITTSPKRRRGRSPKKGSRSAKKATSAGSSLNNVPSSSGVSDLNLDLNNVHPLRKMHSTRSVLKRLRETQDEISKDNSNTRSRKFGEASTSASNPTSAHPTAGTRHIPPLTRKFACVEIVVSEILPRSARTLTHTAFSSATQSSSKMTTTKRPIDPSGHRGSTFKPAGL
ncbi:hypothetical protein J3R30DRAFT_3693646 [Lentinula aciculospora]|uniref:Uncharacterized protein n=1 Tax=Lentinula aciculospora TaxID=153920 RepID=A0A9W9AW81_9AGAR|nr:hypothetical protein J3R30DRAFT_3693646 [Lentinula aciculospora]